MSALSAGAYKSMRREVQRCRDAMHRRGRTRPLVEMREDGPYVGGVKWKISTVRELRREMEARIP